MGNMGGVETAPVALHGRPHSLTITLPPLSVSFFKNRGLKADRRKSELSNPAKSLMKIAMISSEIVPFAKTGGLADVVGTLSVALERSGHEMTLIMPAYRCVLHGGFAMEESKMPLAVPLGERTVESSVLEAELGRNVSRLLIRADRYFDREFLYGTPELIIRITRNALFFLAVPHWKFCANTQ